MSRPPVYLDHAATTPVRPEVLEAMLPYLGEQAFGNPSSPHGFGRRARLGVDRARQQIAEALDAEPGRVVFTSGGTEADNLAVIGAARAARERGVTAALATSAIEHKAVLTAAHEMEREGGQLVTLPVGPTGVVDLDALDQALLGSPCLVSVMWVNNETGVIQPVAAVAERCRAAGVPFHTDAVQAIGKVPVSVRAVGCDALTLSGHKIGAPKGVGALIVRDREQFSPLIHGGGQQHGLRPGTENVAGIVGLGEAVQRAVAERRNESQRLASLRDRLIAGLVAAIPDLVVVGEESDRGPHIACALIPGTDSEALLMHLDLAGVAASSGSACSSGAVDPSHVLGAMGLPRALALGMVRFSLGHASTDADVTRAVEAVPRAVEKVRALAGVLGRG